jgi:hypothetical protein
MTSSNIPRWNLSGDWFDVCKCKIAYPRAFAQTPTYGDCDGVLAYHIKSGQYGNISLDGLNVVVLADFQGNIWAGNTKANIAVFFDESANDEQREALNMIFSGKAVGFMAEFAKLIGEVRGIEYAPVKVKIANDLSKWSAVIPGKVIKKGEALTGPMTPPGKRVQTVNLPGSEVGLAPLQLGEELL